MRGCAAIARVGRISSHSGGNDEAAPCSGIERQAWPIAPAHCVSSAGSLRIRACTAAS